MQLFTNFILKSTIKPILLFIILLIPLTGCKMMHTHGNFIDENTIHKIKETHPTKNELINLIGTPILMPNNSDDTWYYVYRLMSKRAWLQPEVMQQIIVKIQFDKDNIVQDIELIENMQNEHIAIINDKTKTLGKEENSINTFIKNIGRFNKKSDNKKKRRK